MDMLLPFSTFGELTAFNLEVEVRCPRCGRRTVIDSSAKVIRDRRIMGQSFMCKTVLWDGRGCPGGGIPHIKKRGRGHPSVEEHSRLLRSHHGLLPHEKAPL
jgi:hypothetical protein